jgi:hypothetical protein
MPLNISVIPMRDDLAQQIYIARLATKKNAKPPKLIREVEYAFMAANIFFERLAQAQKLQEEITKELEKRKVTVASDEVVHVLKAGLPVCGFNTNLPKDWPPGHTWLAEGVDPAIALPTTSPCPVCFPKK